MKQTIQLTVEVDVTGTLLHDPDTGPDEVVDIQVEEVRLPDMSYSDSQARAEFGNLVDYALDQIDDMEWEED